jgi:hypothetical protein
MKVTSLRMKSTTKTELPAMEVEALASPKPYFFLNSPLMYTAAYYYY